MSDIYLFKTDEERELITRAGHLAASVLTEVCNAAKPGMSTLDLDKIAEEWILSHDAIPTFKGYMGFPATLCTSVNHEVVHGIPDSTKILKDGDIISIDVGVTLKEKVNGKDFNFIGDNARTIPVGTVSDKALKLIADTKMALELGVEQCVVGKKVSNITRAVESVALKNSYGLVRDFGGHGIGSKYHCAPFIPNYTSYFLYQEDCEIQEGMVLAIEPMFNLGLDEVKKLRDGWTIITKDSKLSAHYEYSVLVTKEKPIIITK
jgi:methionyl aminopeptidase